MSRLGRAGTLAVWVVGVGCAALLPALLLLLALGASGWVPVAPVGELEVGGAWLTALGGSVVLLILALGVAAPLGVGSALYLSEFASPGAASTRSIRALFRGMAGVPSVVYGLGGGLVLATVGDAGLALGVAGGTLGLLALPGVVETTERALRVVRHRDAARSLGASRLQVVSRLVLPGAGADIVKGVVARMIDIIGETAPLLLTGVALSLDEGAFAALPHRVYALALSGEPSAIREALLISGGLVALAMVVHLVARRPARAS